MSLRHKSLRYNIKRNRNIKTSIYFRPTESNHLDDIKLLLESNRKMDIYPNSEDETQFNPYNNVTEYIYRIITNTGFLCKGLNPEYILDAFDDADAIVIIGSLMDILPNRPIFGFALIHFDETVNSIYVDVICSHIGIEGAGDTLINAIQEISKTVLMTEIYLKSVKSAIPFYEKYGFIKHDASCDDMCIMIKPIKKYGGKKRTNKNKNLRKKRKTKRNLYGRKKM
jgi:hypothetical protein